MILKAIEGLSRKQVIRHSLILHKSNWPHKVLNHKIMYFFKDSKDQNSNQQNSDQKSTVDQKDRKDLQLEEYLSQQLSEQSLDRNQKYKIISRSYSETKVPGLDTRKYANLNELQQQIIKTNRFDLLNPQIIPKTGATNSYVGIAEQLTQISLGSVKIKGQHEVFLSEIDPQNIPADLDIRFDQQKQLKVVGKQSRQDKKAVNQQQKSKGELKLSIQSQTIEQKTINQHMEAQFGMGVKGYKYSNIKNLRRWDIFLSLLFFAFLAPVHQTYLQLSQCYKTTKAIEEERMKEIKQLKKRSFQKVLFENKDFNKSL